MLYAFSICLRLRRCTASCKLAGSRSKQTCIGALLSSLSPTRLAPWAAPQSSRTHSLLGYMPLAAAESPTLVVSQNSGPFGVEFCTSRTVKHRDNYYDDMNGPSRTPSQGEWSPPPPQFEEHDHIYTAQEAPHANSPPSPYSSMPQSPPPPLSPPLHAHQHSSPQDYQQGYINSP